MSDGFFTRIIQKITRQNATPSVPIETPPLPKPQDPPSVQLHPFDATDLVYIGVEELLNINEPLKNDRAAAKYIDYVSTQFIRIRNDTRLQVTSEQRVTQNQRVMADIQRQKTIFENLITNFLTTHLQLFKDVQDAIKAYELEINPANGVGHYYPTNQIEKYIGIQKGTRSLGEIPEIYISARNILQQLNNYINSPQENVSERLSTQTKDKLSSCLLRINNLPITKVEAWIQIIQALSKLHF